MKNTSPFVYVLISPDGKKWRCAEESLHRVPEAWQVIRPLSGIPGSAKYFDALGVLRPDHNFPWFPIDIPFNQTAKP